MISDDAPAGLACIGGPARACVPQRQNYSRPGCAFAPGAVPPGTSKWNKIEHRLFSFITQNWRGQPLVSYAVILSLITATTTATGLTVESRLDTNTYPVGVKVTDAEMDTLRIERDAFRGEWNYTILPHVA